MDRSRGNSDRNDWGNCLSNGRYHRFLIFDRISLCTNDRCTDCRFLYPSSGFLKKICMYSEYDRMDSWIYRISLADGCGHDPWKYTSGYGDHDHFKCDRKFIVWEEE